MKKSVLKLLVSAVFVLSLTFSAFSHAPSSIRLTYDAGSKNIKVFIAHNTLNSRGAHFIKEVYIWHNDKLITTKTFTSQRRGIWIDESIVVNLPDSKIVPPTKKQDKVKIRAICNIQGELTREFVLK